MRTNRIAGETVNAVSSRNDQFQLTEYIDIFRRNLRLMIAVFVVIVGIGSWWALRQKKIYDSTATVVVPQVQVTAFASNADPGSQLAGAVQGRKVETEAEIISSGAISSAAWKTLTEAEKTKGYNSQDVPAWALNIENKKDTDVLYVRAASYDPMVAAKLANAVATSYLKEDLERNNHAVSEQRKYVQSQISQTQSDLTVASRKLALFKSEMGLEVPGAMDDNLALAASNSRTDLQKASQALDADQKLVGSYGGQLKSVAPTIQSSSVVQQNPQFTAIRDQLDQLETERANQLQEFVPNAPEITKIDDRIRMMKSRLNKTTQALVSESTKARNPMYDSLAGEYANAVAAQAADAARVHSAESALSDLQKSLKRLPAVEQELAGYQRQVDALKRTYDSLSDRYYSLLTQEKGNVPNAIFASHAGPEPTPVSPNVPRLVILFVVFGLFASMAVALAADRLDSRVRDPYLTERQVDLIALSTIPRVGKGPDRLPVIGEFDDKNGAFLESFRVLRNNISFASQGQAPRILAVTSPGVGEGKSAIAINLAIALAMDGKKILLVEGDLRKPTLQGLLGLADEPGFTSVALATASLQEAVQPTRHPNVFCLTSGPLPQNSSELLNSFTAKMAIDQALEVYDSVIIHCPSCQNLSDIQVLSRIAQGVLLAVSMNITIKEQLDSSVESLELIGAPLLGMVLNRVETRQVATMS